MRIPEQKRWWRIKDEKRGSVHVIKAGPWLEDEILPEWGAHSEVITGRVGGYPPDLFARLLRDDELSQE